MPVRNVVSWNALIGAYAQNSFPKEALDIFYCMHVDGPNPDNVTFVSALDACTGLAAHLENSSTCPYVGHDQKWAPNMGARLEALQAAQHMHMAIIDMAFEHDAIIGNALVNLYGKHGALLDAEKLFHMSQHPNVMTWTAILAASSQSGNGEIALLFFRRMILEGIGPTNVTFACALDACASIAALHAGKCIHTTFLYCDYNGDSLVENALMSMYGKCNCVCTAERIFADMGYRDVVSWNSIIATFSQNGCAKEALKFYRLMQHNGVEPDPVTYVSAIDACASLLALKEGYTLHNSVVMIGGEHQPVMGSVLVSMYGNCKVVHEARSVFKRIGQQDIVLWNAMIAALALNEHCMEALDLVNQMELYGLQADKITFCSVLDACASITALDVGKEVHAYITCHGYNQDLMVGTALLDMYAKCGNVSEAKGVFYKVLHRNVITWTAMISCFAQNGEGKEALDLLREMRNAGTELDALTFVSTINACSYTGLTAEGVHYFLAMERDCGLEHNLDHHLSMVDLFGRAGCLDEAENLIHKVPTEEMGVSWECLLASCRVHRDFFRGYRAACHCVEVDPEKVAPFVTLENLFFETMDPCLIG